MSSRRRSIQAASSAVALVCCALTLQGCVSTGPKQAGSEQGNSVKTALQGLACLGGGAVGVVAAKALARYDGQRLKLSAAEVAKRERGYVIGFALLGCGAGSSLAGTAYSKLSEAGKRAREAELREAAASARPRTYRDPENPALTGTVTPQPIYADTENSRECRDIVDNLADSGKGEPIVVKMCRSTTGGGWAQVTA